MKIVHIAPATTYNIGWGYQDNLLPRYQSYLGNEVTYITNLYSFKDGKKVIVNECDEVLSDGVRLIRLPYRKGAFSRITNLKMYLEVFSILKEITPDFIFYHGLVSETIYDVVRYKRECNPKCIIVEDNHLDANIHTLGRDVLNIKKTWLKQYYRHINKKTIPYIEKVYGVTPWRKQYAEEFFGIPKEKTDVLIMGAEDEKMFLDQRMQIREKIRNDYGYSEKDFVIVTGGKIDKKKKIDMLMRACSQVSGVKLLIFGQVDDAMQKEFDEIVDKSSNIDYIGWIASDKVYELFYASDLVFFPGQHSVLWEQACAAKVPCVFGWWPGMQHVDNGGNSVFLKEVTIENISKLINELKYTDKYNEMKAVAESDATDIYLYSQIAKKSLECVKDVEVK